MLVLVALVPIILPLILLTIGKVSVRYSMSITAAIVFILALFVWQVVPGALAASAIQGVHRALTIIWILVGAIMLLSVMQSTGSLEQIRRGFVSISADMRLQAVIIGFAFLSLIEGVSGFGTPAIVVAPLLIALGFRPLVAVCIALVSDTVACTFGAVGTPLLVGLENTASYSETFISHVAQQITLVDTVIATCMPVLLVHILVMWFGKGSISRRWRDIFLVAPWALLVGASYSISALIVVRFISIEFTAIISSLVALTTSLITSKYNIMLPKTAAWSSSKASVRNAHMATRQTSLPLWKAWMPYVLVVLMLLITRTITPIKQILLIVDASLINILGYSSINSVWQVLYSPGTILFFVACVAAVINHKSLRPARIAFLEAINRALVASIALVPTLVMVQIFTNSGINAAGLAAMPIYIGNQFAAMLGQAWTVFAPLLGALGAFIAGSVTVSNLTLAAVQEGIAVTAHLPVVLIVALQTLGAVAGNAIAIHNVVAVCAVTGLSGHEGSVIRRVLPIALLYVAVVAVLGLLVNVFGWTG